MKDRSQLERALAAAERKLAYIQSLIDRGRLGFLTELRLNHICRKIEKLDIALKEMGRELKNK
jgi:hypothetical protein